MSISSIRIASKVKVAIGGDQEFARSLHSSALAFGIRLTGAVLSYLTQVLIARILGAFDYGLYSFAWSCAFLLSAPATMGLDQVLLRYYPAYMVHADFAKAAGFLRFAVTVALLCSLAIIAVSITLTVFIAVDGSKHFAKPMLVAVWAILPLTLASLGRGSGRTLHTPMLAFFPQEVIFPVLLFSMVGAFAIMGIERSAGMVLLAMVISLSIATVGQLAGLLRCLPPQVRTASPQYEVRQWVRAALPIMMLPVFGQLVERSGVLMVGMFLPVEDVAVYNAASRTATIVQFAMVAILAFTVPSFSSLYALGKREELRRYVARVFRWTFWVTALVAITLIALGESIMGLFGRGFTEGTAALVVLAVAQFLLAIQEPAGELLLVTGHQDVIFRIYGVTAAWHILLSAIFIPTFGMEGAAVATALAWMTSAVWINLTVRRHLNIRAFAILETR